MTIAYRPEVTEQIEREKMSVKIYAVVTEDFIRRMRNWAKAGAGLMRSGGNISSIYTLGVRVDRYVSTAPPLLLGEFDDTDNALRCVPIRYRQAVMQFWRYEGQPMRWQARRLRNAPMLSYHTFEAWVIKGHELLRIELASRAALNGERTNGGVAADDSAASEARIAGPSIRKQMLAAFAASPVMTIK